MNTEPKNGIIYCRVSSTEQVDGTSLESQQRMCEEYAIRENISILKIFIEKGESAKTADRTEFIKAISFCSDKKNLVNYFIVYKLDRFARNQLDHVTVRETLRKYKTELKSVTEPINETATGKLMEGILSSFAEFDNSVRTERSVNGMRERLKQGIWVWQAPLGYYRIQKGDNITPDPKLAPYIKIAFEEYAKGTHTFDSLAKYINSKGFMTRQGNLARERLMEKMIKNPLYCGIIKVWDMEQKGVFEPIISEELFYSCQKGCKNSRNTPHLAKNPLFPLRKLVVCPLCKKYLTGSTSTGKYGGKYSYYHHHKQDCSYAKFIPKEHFEQMFVEYLDTITPSKEFETAFKAIILDIWKNNYKKFDEQNERIRKEVKELELKRQKVFDLHQSGTYTDQEFIEQKNFLNQKMFQKLSLIHEKKHDEINMDEALDYCFGFIRQTSKTWLDLEKKPEQRLRFQNLIFEENVEFSKDTFGTQKLTPIYSTYQQYLADPTSMVTLRGIEPRFKP
jgi:site-specific DNA recombinase